MKTDALREYIRKEIKAALKESGDETFLGKVGAGVRARLGTGKTQLDRAMDLIDTERLSKLPIQQKIDLVVALVEKFGIDARSFNIIKTRVAKQLSKVTGPASPEA